MFLKRSSFFLFVSLVFLGCSKGKPKKYQESQYLMGTQVSITVFSEEAGKAARAMNQAFQKISEWEALLSRRREDSDIGRLNKTFAVRVKVSPVTFDVIKRSLEIGKISGGAFDITVAPLLTLWKEAEQKNVPPTQAERKAALNRMGYSFVKLYPETGEVELRKKGMRLDLGGIAKGHIVDRATQVLKSEGIRQGLIDAGGDLYALGNHPERGPWLVSIRNPLKPGEGLKNLEISNKAVATSGHYMRFFTIQGKAYSHIMDPRTGAPVKTNVVSVTIIAEDLMSADALATAVTVLGLKNGLALVHSLPDVEALIITRKGKTLSYFPSNGFQKGGFPSVLDHPTGEKY